MSTPPSNQTTSQPELSEIVDIWKKVIDVQQHFNDIALRIRNYALTLFTAIMGGIGFLEKDKVQLSIFNTPVSATFLLSLFGLFVMLAFWYMDRFWYHNLLVGAVKHGKFIEQKYESKLPELGLTESVGKESPHKLIFSKNKKIHSNQKFNIFFGIFCLPLVFLTVFSLFYKIPKPKHDIQCKNVATTTTRLDTLNNRKDTQVQIIKTHQIETILIADSSIKIK